MENTTHNIKKSFGLLGKNISYSFSKTYFSNKFKTLDLPYSYKNFDIDTIKKLPFILKNNPHIKGFNVTIPYKQAVISYLDDIDKDAENIGAVNTVKILENQKLKGYNTDHYGFKKSLMPFLKDHHKRALIFGTGGASKAIVYVLKQLNIDFAFVSRQKSSIATLTYHDLNTSRIAAHHILIQCTPVGTFPNINKSISIPFEGITNKHLAYDLIYNPKQTQFLKLCAEQGAKPINGQRMLELQAEKSWDIWMN